MPSLSESFIASSSMAEIFATMKKHKSQTETRADANVSMSEKLVMRVVSSEKIVMKIVTPEKTMTKMNSQPPTQLPTVVKNHRVKTLMELANTQLNNVQVGHSSTKGRPLTRREIIHGWWRFLLHFLHQVPLFSCKESKR